MCEKCQKHAKSRCRPTFCKNETKPQTVFLFLSNFGAGYGSHSQGYSSYGYTGSYQNYAQAQQQQYLAQIPQNHAYPPPPLPRSQPGSYPGSYSTASNTTPIGQRGEKRALGSNPSSGSYGGSWPKKARFCPEESGKDDSLIKVDPVLIDKRFNFWNLPNTAKILLVSNLPCEIAKPRPLFHLFSPYGDVTRVKILPHKLTVALVEFKTATMACIARNHLDQVALGKSFCEGKNLGRQRDLATFGHFLA